MREYTEKKAAVLKKAVCNKCGRELAVEKGILKEGVCSVETGFGFFSNKDGQVHSFDLCEECYDQWIKSFHIPVDITEKKELI